MIKMIRLNISKIQPIWTDITNMVHNKPEIEQRMYPSLRRLPLNSIGFIFDRAINSTVFF